MALALVFLFVFSAFSLMPGGCTFFRFGAASLMATFAPLGEVLLMTAAEELALATLQLWLLAFFGEVFSTAVEAFVIAPPGSIYVHGIRVPCLASISVVWPRFSAAGHASHRIATLVKGTEKCPS